MRFKWQHKYEAEAESLVAVLKRWYELQSEIKRLEWELLRCRHPQDTSLRRPQEVEKPLVLRRADAGEPLVSDHKRGQKRSWKERTQELQSNRIHYDADNNRLSLLAQRLTMLLAECQGSEDAGLPASVQVEPELDIEQVRKALAVEEATAAAAGKDAVEEQNPVDLSPLAQAHEEVARLHEQQRTLAQEKAAAEQQVAALERQVEDLAGDLARSAQALKDHQAHIAKLERLRAHDQERFDILKTVPELARRFLQGQRNFLFLHNDPQLDNALTGLIDYALARLATTLATDDEIGVRAMCANLEVVAKRLVTYNGKSVQGFDDALAMLPTLQAEAASEERHPLPLAPERQGPEAKPFLMRLKFLRDVARLDFRPFYYLDDNNQVHRIG